MIMRARFELQTFNTTQNNLLIQIMYINYIKVYKI